MSDEQGGSPIAENQAPEVVIPTEPVADSAPADEPPKAKAKVEVDPDELQGRFDKYTREKYDALRERDSERYRREAIEAELQSLKTAKPEPDAPADYPTLAESGYDEVAHAAKIREFVKGLSKAEVRAAFQQEREATTAAERERTFKKRETEFAATKPDYAEKVLKNPYLPVTNEMGQIIRKSEVGPQLAYYLGENMEKAAEIAQLSPLDQAYELGRIEKSIEAAAKPPVAPSVSKAPPPTPSIKGETPAFTIKADSPESDQLSDAEWKARRDKQVQKSRSR